MSLAFLVCVQLSSELKQKELGNTEKDKGVQVKKQTIDLLPDVENNMTKLQVGKRLCTVLPG